MYNYLLSITSSLFMKVHLLSVWKIILDKNMYVIQNSSNLSWWITTWKFVRELTSEATKSSNVPFQWRDNQRDGASNHRCLDCLLNRLFRRRSKKTSKLRDTGLCDANSPVTGEFPPQRARNAENVPIRWRNHLASLQCSLPARKLNLFVCNQTRNMVGRLFKKMKTHRDSFIIKLIQRCAFSFTLCQFASTSALGQHN